MKMFHSELHNSNPKRMKHKVMPKMKFRSGPSDFKANPLHISSSMDLMLETDIRFFS